MLLLQPQHLILELVNENDIDDNAKTLRDLNITHNTVLKVKLDLPDLKDWWIDEYGVIKETLDSRDLVWRPWLKRLIKACLRDA